MELTLVLYFYYTEQEKENDLLILSILSRKVLLVSGKPIDPTKLVLVDSSSGSIPSNYPFIGTAAYFSLGTIVPILN